MSPVQILAGTLALVTNQSPIIAQAFSVQNGLTPTTARYLKFESLTAANNNAGLNEFEVYSSFTGSTATFNPHPPEVPVVISEVTAAGASPFWIELQNHGAAQAIGGCIIASESG